MERRQFVKACSCAVVAVPVAGMSFLSCTGLYYAQATRSGDRITIPLSEFVEMKDGESTARPFVLVQTAGMAFPICVFGTGATDYAAVLLRCTHQQCTLDVEGEVYTCPCHGSAFSKTGQVLNGPAERDLETFTTSTHAESIVIHLA